jgi:hypothetical protein
MNPGKGKSKLLSFFVVVRKNNDNERPSKMHSYLFFVKKLAYQAISQIKITFLQKFLNNAELLRIS